MNASPSSTTTPLLRREDERLLAGRGAFVGNLAPADALHAVFIRSPYAKASVLTIDCNFAMGLPETIAVLTQKDVAHLPQPQVNTDLGSIEISPLVPLSTEVRYVGAPIGLVLARNRAAAQLAADGVIVDYDAQDAVLDFAIDSHTIARCKNHQGTQPTDQASAVVHITLPRVAASPLEPRAALMTWDEDTKTLTAHLSTQTPARAQSELARALNLTLTQVRVIAIDVGGAFGGKASLFPEDIILADAAKQYKTSILWQATRAEDLLSATHGRGSQLSAQLWADETGKLQALKADAAFTLGAWLPYSAIVPLRNALRILPGPYRVANVEAQGTASTSNAAAVGIYRGAGRPEAAILMERVIDATARKLGLDPLALRLKNVWQTHELPLQISEHAYQDTANFPALLLRCADLFAYEAKRKTQGPLQGIGIALYTEPCGVGGESVRLTANADGTFLLATGSTAQGQGRETSYAHIAAQALGCLPELIQIIHGDTSHTPNGVGALASRSTAIGGSAILAAVEILKTEQLRGQPLPFTVETFHTVAMEAWASGCVMVSMSINSDTGHPIIEELVWVDDAGRVMNSTLVHGQLLGGMAQGIGQALMEQIVYDEYCQLLTGTLMDYALPRATDIPPKIIIESLPCRSQANALGAKGVGEAGCIGVPAAILNAAYDALRKTPDVQLDFPLNAQQLWRALQKPYK